jgi:hypothetical protein
MRKRKAKFLVKENKLSSTILAMKFSQNLQWIYPKKVENQNIDTILTCIHNLCFGVTPQYTHPSMGVNEPELGRAWLVQARLVYFEARLELELKLDTSLEMLLELGSIGLEPCSSSSSSSSILVELELKLD